MTDTPLTYRHNKRGTTYTFIGEAELQAGQPVLEPTLMTVYRCIKTGKLWVRPAWEFNDGRFELLKTFAQPAPPSDVVEVVAAAIDKAILVNSVNPQGVEKVRINVARAAIEAITRLGVIKEPT